MRGEVDVPLEAEVAADERRERRGSNLLRLVALPVACVLLIGASAYTVSIALSPDKPVVSTMCLDSSCTFGMAAGSDPSAMGMSSTMQMQQNKPHHGQPERFVRGALHFFHIP